MINLDDALAVYALSLALAIDVEADIECNARMHPTLEIPDELVSLTKALLDAEVVLMEHLIGLLINRGMNGATIEEYMQYVMANATAAVLEKHIRLMPPSYWRMELRNRWKKLEETDG